MPREGNDIVRDYIKYIHCGGKLTFLSFIQLKGDILSARNAILNLGETKKGKYQFSELKIK